MQSIFESTIPTFLKPIERLLGDPSVSEIMINGHEEIYVEQGGRLVRSDASFPDEERLLAAVKNIAQFMGRPLDRLNSALDGRLPDGSRVHVLLPPAARNGIVVSIRKFSNDTLTLRSLIECGSLTSAAAAFLHVAVNLGKNILISGGTGSGKTSLLNVLSGMIAPGERLIVIEDASELQLRQPHVLRLETQAADAQGRGEITMRALFRSAMRLRPDRVILGEMRGGEAVDVLQAMTSGHAGSMSTLHANSAFDALQRLETLALMGDIAIPHEALRSQVASAIDLVVQVGRLKDGSRRVISISEVADLGRDGQHRVTDLLRLRLEGFDGGALAGHLEPVADAPAFLAQMRAHGITPPAPLPWNADGSPRTDSVPR